MIAFKEFELMRLLRKNRPASIDAIEQCLSQLSYDAPFTKQEAASIYAQLEERGYVSDYAVTEAGYKELEPYKVNNAFILAAGGAEASAKGVYSLPKGLYQVNGEILIERQIRQLKEAGIKEIYVVLGYKKHTYLYLEEKCGVNFVVNTNPKKNNIYSIYAISPLLANSYICNCDNYYSDNPFDAYEYEAFHATVDKEDSSRELLVRKNSRNRIVAVYPDKNGGECLYGHAFFNKVFSNIIRRLIEAQINDFRIDSLFWEEFVARHIDDLDMFAKRYSSDFLLEFDSIKEFQKLDTMFIENVSETLMKKIQQVLSCTMEDIKDVEVLEKGLSNILFTFVVRGEKYIFRYPGGSTSNIITSRRKEVLAQKLAAECGVDNTYIYIDESGCKISKWVNDCQPLGDIYYKDDSFMERLAAKIKVFHDAGRKVTVSEEYYYDPIKEADRLLTLACETMGDLFVRFSDFRAKAIKLFNLCEADGIEKTICHNDINGDNCLLTNDSFDVIDYEFAGFNDPAFDFGRIIGDYDYDSESVDKILAAYFGRPATAVERRHWIAYVGLHDWYYFCWCLYKESINEDTREWMLYFDGRLKAVFSYMRPFLKE